MKSLRVARLALAAAFSCLVYLAINAGCKRTERPPKKVSSTTTAPGVAAPTKGGSADASPAPPRVEASATAAMRKDLPFTYLVTHNVILDTGSPIHLKVKWMRGRMFPTKDEIIPSFDETESYRVAIDEGLIGISLDDLSSFIRSGPLKDSPLKNLKITSQGNQLKVTGTLKRLLPVQVLTSFGVAPDHHHVRLHIDKLSVLKLPVKGLMGALHVALTDLLGTGPHRGISVANDFIDIDMNAILPPPRAEGYLTEVRLWRNGDLMQYYGQPREEALQRKEWRNYMRLRGGALTFGKLTMHNTDLLMVDTSPSDWLHFDIQHYQEQLVNGMMRTTPDAGLQIFLPDSTRFKGNHDISVRWLKNRFLDPPADVVRKQ